MTDQAVHPAWGESAEALLRRELARGEAMAESLVPVLRHLVMAQDTAVLGEDVLSHVRGMVAALADELLAAPGHDTDRAEPELVDRLRHALVDDAAILAHLHALAFEWHLVERLQDQLALDPVLSPLLQAAISSPDAGAQSLAMAWLAAQARWCQSQRRMTIALRELPAELLHQTLLVLRDCAPDRAGPVEAALQQSYDEATTRLALGTRLVATFAGGEDALSPTGAGVSLFLSALAFRAGIGRDAAVACCHDGQVARLVVALGAAGLAPARIGEIVLSLHPEDELPAGLDRLDRQLAILLLAGTGAGAAA